MIARTVLVFISSSYSLVGDYDHHCSRFCLLSNCLHLGLYSIGCVGAVLDWYYSGLYLILTIVRAWVRGVVLDWYNNASLGRVEVV